MDIAVCGAQVPFMRGGAELHMENLVRALERRRAPRRAGPPADGVGPATASSTPRWRGAWCRSTPTSSIATNFPSYFVRHRARSCGSSTSTAALRRRRRSRGATSGSTTSRSRPNGCSPSGTRAALGEARHVFTTSRVVAHRLARFNGLAAEPLYHPPPLHDRLHAGPFGDYVFCATRLEGNKRPEPHGRAAAPPPQRHARAIAGTRLAARRAARRGRAPSGRVGVDLLGFVDDHDLVDLYAGRPRGGLRARRRGLRLRDAAGVPRRQAGDHDADAGGVLEWVEDGVTGFVTDGSPAGIAAAIDKLAFDPELAPHRWVRKGPSVCPRSSGRRSWRGLLG